MVYACQTEGCGEPALVCGILCPAHWRGVPAEVQIAMQNAYDNVTGIDGEDLPLGVADQLYDALAKAKQAVFNAIA